MENYKVYKHTSPNGKVYIGVTCKKVNDRWGKNGSGYCDNEYFYKAIKKYGWDNFKHEILFEGLTKEEACQKEIELIAEYKSNNSEFGYNLSAGGEHSFYGCKHNENSKKLIGKSSKERMNNFEYKQNFKTKMLGHQVTQQTREKISKAKKGIPTNNHSCKNRVWVNNGENSHLIKKDELNDYLNNGFILGRAKYESNAFFKSGKDNICYGKIPWNKGKKWDDNIIEKLSVDRKDRKWIHNEYENKCVKDAELNFYLSNGYVLGRNKNNDNNGSKIWVHNDLENKWINSNDLEIYLQQGYILGMLKRKESNNE